MRKVAIVRGEALNPFEMQSYRPLIDEFDLLLVGRSNPNYEVDNLKMPVVLLHNANEQRLTAGIARRLARHGFDQGDRLLGFERAVRDRDLLHGAETAIYATAQCIEVARKTGAKVVLTCWENIPFRFDEDPTLARRKAVARERCDLFVAVTPLAREALLTEGVDDARIVVIPAGIDTDRFTPQPRDPEFLSSFGLPSNAFVVLFIGRMIQEKGVVDLVRATARVPASQGPVHLVMVGNGPEHGRAAIAATALGCSDRVHFVSAVSYQRVPQLYAMADLVVVPSLSTPYWQEQFGMVLVEAMASGRAIVTTRSGSIPEVVGNSAVLVTPYDVDALADAITMLVRDADQRNALAHAARAMAESTYAIGRVSPQLAAAYRRLLGD